jgi:hypothetical protein
VARRVAARALAPDRSCSAMRAIDRWLAGAVEEGARLSARARSPSDDRHGHFKNSNKISRTEPGRIQTMVDASEAFEDASFGGSPPQSASSHEEADEYAPFASPDPLELLRAFGAAAGRDSIDSVALETWLVEELVSQLTHARAELKERHARLATSECERAFLADSLATVEAENGRLRAKLLEMHATLESRLARVTDGAHARLSAGGASASGRRRAPHSR